LSEIYYRLLNYVFLLSEQKADKENFINVFYKGIDIDTTYFILDDAPEKRQIELCIVLRIVCWETINDIPWADIEKVFRFSKDTISLKKVFELLQSNIIMLILYLNGSICFLHQFLTERTFVHKKTDCHF